MSEWWKITVAREGDKYIARVLEPSTYDQREGQAYRTIGIALGDDKDETVAKVVQEVFC